MPKKSNVTDIGFGLGYSAKAIYERVNNYTCIEINPQIYKKAFLDNKEKLNFNLMNVRWYCSNVCNVYVEDWLYMYCISIYCTIYVW